MAAFWNQRYSQYCRSVRFVGKSLIFSGLCIVLRYLVIIYVQNFEISSQKIIIITITTYLVDFAKLAKFPFVLCFDVLDSSNVSNN